MPLPDDAALLDTIRRDGVVTTAMLMARYRTSQPTVSRALAPLLARGALIRVGGGPRVSYLVPRAVPGVREQVLPLTRVDADGAPHRVGTLVPLSGGRYWLDAGPPVRAGRDAVPGTLYDGLPWFLSDLRPQGFMGRHFARQHPELRLADSPEAWSDDDVLRVLVLAGDDLPGDLLLGSLTLERWQAAARVPPVRQPVSAFAALAQAALAGQPGASSAGGAQPKFCTTGEDGAALIVKFSPADDTPSAQRWRDLLVAEHLALAHLAQAGVPAADSLLVADGGRVFLAVRRFDRTTAGRQGLVSLLAFNAEVAGEAGSWAEVAERLYQRGALSAGDRDQALLLDAFGRLIANDDRHLGNLSLQGPGGSPPGPAWRLAPVYDMLPMALAPLPSGELVTRDLDPAQMAPTALTLPVWPRARALAAGYWQRVAADARVTAGFAARAAQWAQGLVG